MDFPISLPGYPNLNLVLRTGGLFSGSKIFYDGAQLEAKKREYTVIVGGSDILAFRLKPSLDFYAPRIEFRGAVIKVVPSLPGYQIVWAFLPLLLIFWGGFAGGLCGGAAYMGTLSVLHSKMPAAMRLLLALLIPFIGFALYLAIAIVVQLLLRKT